MVHVTEEQILEAIKDSAGIISMIAERLKCEWHTAQRLIQRAKSTKMAYSAEKELILDVAESNIISSIQGGDIISSKWYLGLKGKERGYVEEKKVDVNFGDIEKDKAVQDILSRHGIKPE